jgi:hypothetical protein
MTSHLAAVAVATVSAAALTAAVPAAAEAAPANLRSAIVTATDFPAGYSGYRVETGPADDLHLSPTGARPECATAITALKSTLGSGTTVFAGARNAVQEFDVGLFSRPATAQATAVILDCAVDFRTGPQTRPAVPADLARYSPAVFGSDLRDGKITQYLGYADVAGTTVKIGLYTHGGRPADLPAFWQMFRTQIQRVTQAH